MTWSASRPAGKNNRSHLARLLGRKTSSPHAHQPRPAEGSESSARHFHRAELGLGRGLALAARGWRIGLRQGLAFAAATLEDPVHRILDQAIELLGGGRLRLIQLHQLATVTDPLESGQEIGGRRRMMGQQVRPLLGPRGNGEELLLRHADDAQDRDDVPQLEVDLTAEDPPQRLRTSTQPALHLADTQAGGADRLLQEPGVTPDLFFDFRSRLRHLGWIVHDFGPEWGFFSNQPLKSRFEPPSKAGGAGIPADRSGPPPALKMVSAVGAAREAFAADQGAASSRTLAT